jgi:hypothetical protein
MIKPKENSEECRLENVTILNRLGATYYIETSEGTTFTLPNSAVKSRELPAPALLEANIEPVGGNEGSKALKLTLRNLSRDEITDITARVEIRGGDGRLRQSDSVEFGDLLVGQNRDQRLNLSLDSYAGESSYFVFLSRHGRELPYIKKWEK